MPWRAWPRKSEGSAWAELLGSPSSACHTALGLPVWDSRPAFMSLTPLGLYRSQHLELWEKQPLEASRDAPGRGDSGKQWGHPQCPSNGNILKIRPCQGLGRNNSVLFLSFLHILLLKAGWS